MGRPRMVPLLLAIALVAATISSASARDGHHPLHGSVNTTTPAGGQNTVTSGTVPDSVDVFDAFLGRRVDETTLFKTLTFTLMQVKSRKHRTVACAIMAAAHLESARAELEDRDLSHENVETIAQTRVAAIAAMCMRLARLMAEIEAEQPTRPARRAGDVCDVEPVALRINTERTADGGYRLTPAGQVTNGAKAMPAKVTCKITSRRLTFHVVPKKHKKARAVVGKNVKLGIVSPSTATAPAHVKVGFTSPR